MAGSQSWLDAELAGSAFADERLGKRLRVLLERLRALDPDALSPREAHALLCELHGAAREIY